MENKTAVEWFYEQLYGTPRTIWEEELNQIREQANQMFQEQIIETWKHGNLPTFLGRVLTAEEYYNETYGK
jgi:hypothetical protein